VRVARKARGHFKPAKSTKRHKGGKTSMAGTMSLNMGSLEKDENNECKMELNPLRLTINLSLVLRTEPYL
jgi:hypothetical protein